MTHTEYRSDNGEIGKMGMVRVVATALAVTLAIGLAAGCSPTSVTSTTPPGSPVATADSAPERGQVTVYLEPT